MKKHIAPIIICIGSVVSFGRSQEVYTVPFASSGNSIELTVVNTSTIPASALTVEATGLPSWLRFQQPVRNLPVLKANQEAPVLFSFAIDKSAPVRREHAIRFTISAATGEKWMKEIKIEVAPPEKFDLFQNYPNPFNPTTIISYQLPAPSHIKLTVFNLLGQEVTTIVDADKPAGFYQETFDAHGCSSGMYVYQLALTDEHGKRQIMRRTMVLLR